MKLTRIILISCAFLLTSLGLSLAADPIAVVIKSSGKAQIEHKTDKKKSDIERGTKVFPGDKITTGDDGSVSLRFIDDRSLLRIRANSNCTVNGEKEKNSIAKNVYVEAGVIFSKITKQNTKFKVVTPTSVASVKGTEFWTRQEFKGGTYYYGEEGVVEIANEAGTALLQAGETGYVSSPRSKPQVQKTKPGEKPEAGDDEDDSDEFEFDLKNEQGTQKVLKFKATRK